MLFVVETLFLAGGLFAAMLLIQEAGRRLGLRDQHQAGGKTSHGAVEGAVFALLGLFLAFSFSGAGGRFENRRQLIVQEVNAIGTAWLRIDVLPEQAQAEARDLFRQYLDARLDTYRLVPDMPAVMKAHAHAIGLQQRIWAMANAAARTSGQMQVYTVMLPALNQMFDLTTTRTAAAEFHPPRLVFGMIGLLALIGALFAGYAQAGSTRVSLIHRFGFAAVLAISLYVIVDLEYPRLGLIRVDAADRLLVDLRQSMN